MRGSPGTKMTQPPAVFDIDNDRQPELSIPATPVSFYDYRTGDKEASITGGYPRSTNWTLLFIDSDDDGFVEICFGYFDAHNTSRYHLELVRSSQPTLGVNHEIIPDRLTLYAGINRTMGLTIYNMTEEYLPRYVGMYFSNDEQWSFNYVNISILNSSIEQSGSDSFSLSGFSHSLDGSEFHISFDIAPEWRKVA